MIHNVWASGQDFGTIAYAQMPLINFHACVSSKFMSKFLVLAFIYIHTLYMQAVKALASQLICADLPEPSLLADEISIKVLCTGPYFLNIQIP